MRRLLAPAGASLLLYAALFGLILDRPLSLGPPRALLDARLARAEGIMGPKLVILAGSNGPYSHRCETMEPILGRPCVNGGLAVGFSLDYLFARWKPRLHPGDIVYLPLEEAHFTRPRQADALGPDAAIMARHDRVTLASLPPQRWLGALFAFDARAGVMSLIEMALLAGGFQDPRDAVTGTTNAWGDHAGHTAALAAANQAMLAAIVPRHARPADIAAGAAHDSLTAFLAWARQHEVLAIGGRATTFADSPPPADTVAALRALFETGSGAFLALPNGSTYPRGAFFDTADHLHEAAQIAHSIRIAQALRAFIAARESPSFP